MSRRRLPVPASAERRLPWRGWVMPLLGVALASALAVWGVDRAADPRAMPIRVVGVDGEIQHLHRETLESAVAEAVNGSFFSVDLEQVRRRVERLPWIESVSVRRVWPDTLRVRVVEQVPLAYWGKDGLVNERGEIFRPGTLPRLEGLATLEGADEDAVRITREFLRMRTLLETAGLELRHVWVDPRLAWRLETGEGVLLNLGRREVMPRLSRFVQLYPFLTERAKATPASVDLRYTNGFSVRWRDTTGPQVNLESRTSGVDAARIAGI